MATANSHQQEGPLPAKELPWTFDPSDRKYRCFCGAIHVKQASLIIAIIASMMIIFSVFAVPLSLSESLWWNIGQGLLIAIDLLTIVCLFYGLRAEKHLFLLPYIVYQSVCVVTFLTGALLAVFTFFYPFSREGEFMRDQLVDTSSLDHDEELLPEKKMVQVTAVFMTITFALATVIGLWWVEVVFRCFQYFRDQSRWRNTVDATKEVKEAEREAA
ncbi:Protein C05E11.3 a [Aphelenchoides avenae]|nr:Protein C05E11.3 a [Aphelenchus avenae]